MFCYSHQKGLERLFLCGQEGVIGSKIRGISHQQGHTAETVSDDFAHGRANTSSILSESKNTAILEVNLRGAFFMFLLSLFLSSQNFH